jgi:DNA topoisomerase-1
MTDALVEVTTLDFSPIDQEQSWITKGEIIKFDGFMKLYIEGSDDDEEEDSSTILPDISA